MIVASLHTIDKHSDVDTRDQSTSVTRRSR